MNRMLKIAFGAVLGTAVLGSAVAQNFPDVPEYAWAYDAVLNLKNEGILQGYPDGMFKGGRSASRYELAAAVNSAYEKLKGMIGGLQNQVDTLNRRVGDLERAMANKADKSEIAALRDAISRMQADIDRMRGWGKMIDDLKKLVDLLAEDLKKIRGDVDGMKADLDDMKKRIEALEKRKPAVDIHGDVNLVLHAGHSTDDNFGITVDGRPTGFGRGDYFGDPVGMTRDLTIGHEAAFQFSGTNDTGPKWHATLVVGNLIGFVDDEGVFGTIYGNQSQQMFSVPFAEPNESVYFQDFAVDLDTSLFGQNFSAALGRVGYQAGSYFFRRQDRTPYFANTRWDDGNWYFDGGVLMFDWGNVSLDVWGGRQSGRTSTSGSGFFLFSSGEVWPMTAGPAIFAGSPSPLVIDQHLGFSLNFEFSRGNVMLNYIFLDSNLTPLWSGEPVNRVTVFGGEVNFDISNNLWINGGYSQSNLNYNTSNVLDEDNAAYWVRLGYEADRWGAGIGYRHIDPYFGAPGSWGRVAFFYNLVDHEGFHGWLNFNVNDKTKINLKGFLYEGLDGVILSPDEKMTGFMGDVFFMVNPMWELRLGAEWVEFQDADFNILWYRVGLNWMMDDASSLNFLYEASDADNLSFAGGSDAKGGLLTIQWKRKF